MLKNTIFTLNKRPKGIPDNNCWKLIDSPIRNIKKNEILIENMYLSIDPYMRGRMNAGKSYAPPVNIGEIMVGETLGRVVKSNSKKYLEGDLVCVHKGWQKYTLVKDNELTLIKVPKTDIPTSVFLGALGMPGRTAFFGLTKVAKPNQGETVVISAASGAVGAVVTQLAKIYECNVVGIAGGYEKCKYVTDTLGANNCIDYKNDNVLDKLHEYCPNGIDIYFENVGGDITRDISKVLNKNSRVPICGFISKYNSINIANEETPFTVFKNMKNPPKHRFFVVREWAHQFESATKTLLNYMEDGQLSYKETITEGFENAPQALRDVLSGKNFGKQLIKF